MKKWFLIFMIILLTLISASCSKDENVSAPAEAKYINDPQIEIYSGHDYQGTSWLGKQVEATDTSVRLSGDMIGFQITYESSLYSSNYLNKVKVIGYEEPLELSLHDGYMGQSKIIYGTARNIEHGKEYTLHVPQDLINDQDGNILKNDINISILIEEDPKAYYSLIGTAKTYTGLGQMESNPQSVHERIFLTTEPKTFEVEFTKDVNKPSVEESINNGIKDMADVRFQWIDSRKMKIYLDKLSADTEYLLSMKDAVDLAGYDIIGNLFFRTNEINQLSVIDIKTKNTRILKEFHDTSYIAWPTREIHNLILLDNTKESYVYDLAKGEITSLNNVDYGFGMPELDWYLNWMDPETILIKEEWESLNNIYTVNLLDGRKEKLFELSSSNFYDAMLSPDRKKIVFTSYDHIAELSIFVYSLDGKLLYKGEGIASGETKNIFPTTIYIQWLDADHLVFLDKDDVVMLDIRTGEKEIILRKATKPVTLPGTEVVLAQKKEKGEPGSILWTKGEIRELLAGQEISNPNIISEDKFVFNIGEDVYLYDLEKDQKEKIGQGFILGLSPDKEAVYCLTNFDNLYWHLDW